MVLVVVVGWVGGAVGDNGCRQAGLSGAAGALLAALPLLQHLWGRAAGGRKKGGGSIFLHGLPRLDRCHQKQEAIPAAAPPPVRAAACTSHRRLRIKSDEFGQAGQSIDPLFPITSFGWL